MYLFKTVILRKKNLAYLEIILQLCKETTNDDYLGYYFF